VIGRLSELMLGTHLTEGGELIWTTPAPWVAAAALAAAAALGLASVSGRGSRTFWWELALLGPALALVVVGLAGPVWVEESGHIESPRLAVLIDDSRSMGALEGGHPRSDAVASVLGALDDEAGAEPPERYTFGRELAPGGPGDFEQGASDLGHALSRVADRYAGERLAGVVVVTDGLDRGALRAGWREGLGLDLPELPGPLTIYQVGGAEAVKDLSVARIDSGGFAFLREEFTLTAWIEAAGGAASGYTGWEVPVTLTRDGQVQGQLNVTLDDTGRARVDFPVTPRDVGRFSYAVSVPVWEGDAVPANNTTHVAVRVVRDRMRILQVCGAPSFDQKFLRLFLKQDPSVDLVSFFILRTNEDMHSGYHNDELSLIPFPYERLFSDDLWTFDVVIFQNFDYAPFFRWKSDELLENMVDYVRRDGKAFVMLGGDRSFDLGEYDESPLADILPVRLGVGEPSVDVTGFQPALTPAGAQHPITRLVGEPVENQKLWERLSPLDGLNLSSGLAPGSASLLVHPRVNDDSGLPMPVLAVREVGAGRTMALMGDSSWRWVMAESARGHGNQAYLRFWKNALRWLIRDPEARPVQVETTRENYRIGEPVRVVVRARDVGFNPLAGAEITGEIQGPGEATPIEATTDTFGEAVVELPAEARGSYRVIVSARTQGGVIGGAETVFAVTERDPELDEVAADAAFLRALAEVTGGKYVPPGAIEPPLRDGGAGRRVLDRVETPLWSAPGLALFAGLFAGIAWILRRRSGYR